MNPRRVARSLRVARGELHDVIIELALEVVEMHDEFADDPAMTEIFRRADMVRLGTFFSRACFPLSAPSPGCA